MALQMPLPVEAPKAVPPQSGLLAACDKIDRLFEGPEVDEHFGLGGITYAPESTGRGAFAHSVMSDTEGTEADRADESDVKTGSFAGASADALIVSGYPFEVVIEETCSAFGWQANDYEARVQRRLKALQSKIIEWEFWTGELAQADGLDPAVYQWLSQERVAAAGGVPAHGVVDLTPAGGAVDSKHALALLEKALGEGGTGTGFIHTSRQMAILMPDRWTDGPIITWPDSVVAVGSGYPGTGPDGTTPDGEEWVYATNLCAIWLSRPKVYPETLEQAVNRKKNTITYRAERTAAVSWDGDIHVGVRVTI